MAVGQFRKQLVLRNTRQHLAFRSHVGREAVELEIGISIGRGELQAFQDIHDDGGLNAVAVGIGIPEKSTIADIGDADHLVFHFHDEPGDVEINTLPDKTAGANLKAVRVLGIYGGESPKTDIKVSGRISQLGKSGRFKPGRIVEIETDRIRRAPGQTGAWTEFLEIQITGLVRVGQEPVFNGQVHNIIPATQRKLQGIGNGKTVADVKSISLRFFQLVKG